MGALCIAFSPIFTKMTGLPGLSSAFYRVAIAFVLFLPYVLYKRCYIIDLKKLALPLFCGLLFALDLAWDGVHLPPDQLGVACEVFACAIDAAEPVLVRELCARYLLPWCDTALARLPAGSAMGPVLDQFRADVTLASAHPH